MMTAIDPEFGSIKRCKKPELKTIPLPISPGVTLYEDFSFLICALPCHLRTVSIREVHESHLMKWAFTRNCH